MNCSLIKHRVTNLYFSTSKINMPAPKGSDNLPFVGFSRNRFEVFRQEKEDIFHKKYGRFASKNSVSLGLSKEITMVEPGALFVMENLFEDSQEKLTALGSICKLLFNSVEQIKALHTKLRLQTMTQNNSDLSSHKQKLSMALSKVAEIEGNIGELKRVRPEEDKKYQALVKRNIITSLTIRLREKMIFLNRYKNLSQSSTSSEFDFLEQEDVSYFKTVFRQPAGFVIVSTREPKKRG